MSTQTYSVYVKAAPKAIWDALTQSEWSERYGYRAPIEYELRPGGAYRASASEEMRKHGGPEVIIEGEVVEADPPRRLVQTWNPLFGPPVTDEPTTRLTFELEPGDGGVTKLTLTHELEGAPTTAAMVTGTMADTGGGWPFVLSDLKTLLETGAPLAA
jgi:uncharacterized protein YndB with AHSA1/START domain